MKTKQENPFIAYLNNLHKPETVTNHAKEKPPRFTLTRPRHPAEYLPLDGPWRIDPKVRDRMALAMEKRKDIQRKREETRLASIYGDGSPQDGSQTKATEFLAPPTRDQQQSQHQHQLSQSSQQPLQQQLPQSKQQQTTHTASSVSTETTQELLLSNSQSILSHDDVESDTPQYTKFSCFSSDEKLRAALDAWNENDSENKKLIRDCVSKLNQWRVPAQVKLNDNLLHLCIVPDENDQNNDTPCSPPEFVISENAPTRNFLLRFSKDHQVATRTMELSPLTEFPTPKRPATNPNLTPQTTKRTKTRKIILEE